MTTTRTDFLAQREGDTVSLYTFDDPEPFATRHDDDPEPMLSFLIASLTAHVHHPHDIDAAEVMDPSGRFHLATIPPTHAGIALYLIHTDGPTRVEFTVTTRVEFTFTTR